MGQAWSVSQASERSNNDDAYAEWLALLDEHVRSFLDIGLEHLPALRLREAFQAGYSPAEVFAGAIYEISLGMSDGDR